MFSTLLIETTEVEILLAVRSGILAVTCVGRITNKREITDDRRVGKKLKIEMRPLCRINLQNLVSVASCSTCCAPAKTTSFNGNGGASSEKFVRHRLLTLAHPSSWHHAAERWKLINA